LAVAENTKILRGRRRLGKLKELKRRSVSLLAARPGEVLIR